MELTSKVRKVCSLPRQAAGQRRDKKAKTKSCPTEFNGYGFLAHRFSPLVNGADALAGKKAIEREFFNSLSNLAALYQFVPLDVSSRCYPDNIRCAYQDALKKMQIKSKLQLLIVQDEQHIACLATLKQFYTSGTLYYIPVRPLWDLLQNKDRRSAGNLLQSIFCYLYSVAKLPYYRDQDSYLYYTYEMMEEWIKSNDYDYETDDFTAMVANLHALQHYGDVIRRKIASPRHLEQFEQRVRDFTPTDDFENEVHILSKRFFDLYRAFPNATVFDHIHEGLIDPAEEDRLSLEQSLSFFWDYNDCLYDSLYETVNDQLKELGVADEPIALQFFDTPQKKESPHKLEFEESLFELINDLCSLL